MAEFVRLEVEDAIGTIRLDRPPVNALNRQVQEEIRDAATEAGQRSDVRAVIVYGGPKAFAAGADIKEFSQMSHAEMTARARGLSSSIGSVAEIPKPTVAALTGAALGGGFELAMSCDLRIAAEHASLGLPETGLGMLPGAGGTQRLSRLVGAGRALEMVLTGRALTAVQAEQYGLVTTVVPAAELLPTAHEIMAGVLRRGPLAIRLAKMIIGPGGDTDQRTGLLLEQLAQTLLYTTQDKAEGTAAFLDKRPPDFEGR